MKKDTFFLVSFFIHFSLFYKKEIYLAVLLLLIGSQGCMYSYRVLIPAPLFAGSDLGDNVKLRKP